MIENQFLYDYSSYIDQKETEEYEKEQRERENQRWQKYEKEQREREERIQQKIANHHMPTYDDLVDALGWLIGKDGLYENENGWEIDEAKRIYQAAAELVPQRVWLLDDGCEMTLFETQYRCKIMDVSGWTLEEIQEKPEEILDKLRNQNPLLVEHGNTPDEAKSSAQLHCRSHYWQVVKDKQR